MWFSIAAWRRRVKGSRTPRPSRMSASSASISNAASSAALPWAGIPPSPGRTAASAGPSPLRPRLADVHALDDPEPDGQADQRRAAVRDERQRDAGDRHDPDDHPEVDDELEQDHRRDPGREHHPERVLRSPAADE